MKTYTPWTIRDSRIVVARDLVFNAPMKWEGRVRVECDLFGDEGPVYDIDGNQLYWCPGCGWYGSDDHCYCIANTHPVAASLIRHKAFSVIDRSQATFMAVTKEPGRVRELWPARECRSDVCTLAKPTGVTCPEESCDSEDGTRASYRPNLHLFTEAHNQADVDARVPALLKCRDLSPSLGIWFRGLEGEVSLDDIAWIWHETIVPHYGENGELIGEQAAMMPQKFIDTIVIEGTDQPLHPSWVRSLRDQCLAAGCKFVFLGWGDWVPAEIRTPSEFMAMEHKQWTWLDRNGESGFTFGTKDRACMVKVGRESAGRMLDGKLWGWE